MTKEDVIGKSLKDIRPNIDEYCLIDVFRKVWETGESNFFPAKAYIDENYSNYYENRVFKLPSGEIVAIYDDVTERKAAEKTLQESEARYKALFKNVSDAIYIFNPDTFEIIEANEATSKIYGYSNDELIGMSCLKFSAEVDESKAAAKNAKEDGEVTVNVRHHKKKDGTDVFVYLSAYKIIVNEQDMMFAVCRDITESKRADEEIKKQFAEKEILLREAHHRIKNNMNNVESLLSMQAGATDNPEAKAAIEESLTRVKSIRVLYDKLLLGKEYHDISIKSYVEGLLDTISSVYVTGNEITVQKQITDFTIDSKKAASLGIIINELLTNVFKYAFEGRENGIVSISIGRNENKAILIIQDNGIGIDERINLNKSPGLGHTLVKMLVEQLGGTYSIVNENGTKSTIQFEI